MLLLCSLSNAFIFNHPYGEIENTFILNHPEVLNDIGPFYSILPLLVLTASFFILYFAKKFKINTGYSPVDYQKMLQRKWKTTDVPYSEDMN